MSHERLPRIERESHKHPRSTKDLVWITERVALVDDAEENVYLKSSGEMKNIGQVASQKNGHTAKAKWPVTHGGKRCMTALQNWLREAQTISGMQSNPPGDSLI